MHSQATWLRLTSTFVTKIWTSHPTPTVTRLSWRSATNLKSCLRIGCLWIQHPLQSMAIIHGNPPCLHQRQVWSSTDCSSRTIPMAICCAHLKVSAQTVTVPFDLRSPSILSHLISWICLCSACKAIGATSLTILGWGQATIRSSELQHRICRWHLRHWLSITGLKPPMIAASTASVQGSLRTWVQILGKWIVRHNRTNILRSLSYVKPNPTRRTIWLISPVSVSVIMRTAELTHLRWSVYSSLDRTSAATKSMVEGPESTRTSSLTSRWKVAHHWSRHSTSQTPMARCWMRTIVQSMLATSTTCWSMERMTTDGKILKRFASPWIHQSAIQQWLRPTIRMAASKSCTHPRMTRLGPTVLGLRF